MSLLDNVRQTLTDAAESAVEKGQNLGDQARLQVAIKKLQLERAKRTHELGTRTFDWYQSGSLTVGGIVPPDVTTMCHQLADVQRQMDEMQRQMEEARLRAEEARLSDPTASQVTSTVVASPVVTPPPAPPVYTPPVTNHSTTVLPNPDAPNPPYPGSTSDPMMP